MQTVALPNGSIALSVTTRELPVPDLSYQASTATAIQTEDGLCRFVFAQFRGLSRDQLQTAVAVEIPLRAIRSLTQAFEEDFRKKMRAAKVGEVSKFPLEQHEVNTITYSAHLTRILVNPDLGSALDFFQVPLSERMDAVNIQSVIRINCSSAVANAFVDWCDKFGASELDHG